MAQRGSEWAVGGHAEESRLEKMCVGLPSGFGVPPQRVIPLASQAKEGTFECSFVMNSSGQADTANRASARAAGTAARGPWAAEGQGRARVQASGDEDQAMFRRVCLIEVSRHAQQFREGVTGAVGVRNIKLQCLQNLGCDESLNQKL